LSKMTGLDTNVLIRFVMADDAAQAASVKALLLSFSAQSPGFISLVGLAEFVWVLRSKYRQPKSTIIQWIGQFLCAAELVFESQAAVELALNEYSNGAADFADCLIEQSGKNSGCKETVTFDRSAARDAGMRLLPS
jgi:predicted nucleic-acid-binding protein